MSSTISPPVAKGPDNNIDSILVLGFDLFIWTIVYLGARVMCREARKATDFLSRIELDEALRCLADQPRLYLLDTAPIPASPRVPKGKLYRVDLVGGIFPITSCILLAMLFGSTVVAQLGGGGGDRG